MSLAKYYLALRDKIAALNLGVLAFTFTIFEQVKKFEFTYFIFLILLGLFSGFAAYRASLAFNYHFRNYEDAAISMSDSTFDVKNTFLNNRAIYAAEKRRGAVLNLGTSLIPSHLFWSFFIGLICPVVAVFSLWPWSWP